MKIVHWDDKTCDPVIVHADGDRIIIEDHPHWDNLEVGDMIQHTSEGFGTSCYFVTDVSEPDPSLHMYPRGAKLVTILGALG